MTKKDTSAEDRETGRRIREVRVEARASQAAFAKALDVTGGAVGNWERGQGIKRENLQKIASAFDVSFNWLATGKGTRKEQTLDDHIKLLLPDILDDEDLVSRARADIQRTVERYQDWGRERKRQG